MSYYSKNRAKCLEYQKKYNNLHLDRSKRFVEIKGHYYKVTLIRVFKPKISVKLPKFDFKRMAFRLDFD